MKQRTSEYEDLPDQTKPISNCSCGSERKTIKEIFDEFFDSPHIQLVKEKIKAKGRLEGRIEGYAEGYVEAYCRFIIKGMISCEEASLESGLPIEDLKEAIEVMDLK